MGLAETDIIDFVVENKSTGGYDLLVYDGGEIEDEIQRYALLTEKLSSYASFVFGEEITEQYPEANESSLRVCVLCSTAPNEAMTQLEAIKSPDDPEKRLAVSIMMEDKYFEEIEAPSGEEKVVQSKPWWKIW